MTVTVLPVAAVLPRRMGMTVRVKGLEVQAGIGVYDHEKGRLQLLVIDVELDLGCAPVRGLADTLDYDGVASICRQLAEGEHIELVETFAEKVALACMDDPRVLAVTVSVDKPGAIRGAKAAGCAVSYAR